MACLPWYCYQTKLGPFCEVSYLGLVSLWLDSSLESNANDDQTWMVWKSRLCFVCWLLMPKNVVLGRILKLCCTILVIV
jgi:hypothetical protein